MTSDKRHPRPFQSRDEFIQFVRAVSPDADVTSVLLFGQVHRASHQLVHIAEKRLEATGLTWPKFRLLMSLLHSEQQGNTRGIMPSELSERQNISRNTASALIGSLESDGYITRAPHGDDRRKYLIQLTPKGRKILRAQMDNHFTFIGECFAALTAKERQTLCEWLSRVNDHLGDQIKTL